MNHPVRMSYLRTDRQTDWARVRLRLHNGAGCPERFCSMAASICSLKNCYSPYSGIFSDRRENARISKTLADKGE